MSKTAVKHPGTILFVSWLDYTILRDFQTGHPDRMVQECDWFSLGSQPLVYRTL